MNTNLKNYNKIETRTGKTDRKRQIAWVLILIVDLAYIVWGGLAAAMPDGLIGPGGKAILPAGFEGYTGGSWPELLSTAPITAEYMIVLFRLYGIYCVVFGILTSIIAATAFRRGDRWAWWALLLGNTIALGAAMRYDWMVNAIGPFELTEYAGLGMVWIGLALTIPFSGGNSAGQMTHKKTAISNRLKSSISTMHGGWCC